MSLGSRKAQGHVRRASICGKYRTLRPRNPFRASLPKRNAHGQFTRTFRDSRFVRACGVEIHMDILQEPFCEKITRKMPCCHTRRPRHPFGASLRVRNAHGHFTGPYCTDIYMEMPYASTATPILREPARSTCTWISQEPFCLEIEGNCQPRRAPPQLNAGPEHLP